MIVNQWTVFAESTTATTATATTNATTDTTATTDATTTTTTILPRGPDVETGLYSAVESVFDLGSGSRFVFSRTETLLKRVKPVASYSWLRIAKQLN